MTVRIDLPSQAASIQASQHARYAEEMKEIIPQFAITAALLAVAAEIRALRHVIEEHG